VFVKGPRLDRPGRVVRGRMIVLQAAGERGDVPPRLGNGNPWLQSSERHQELVGPGVVAVLFRLENGRRPDFDAPIEERVERAWHHSDHLERLAAEEDLPADDAAVRSEAPLPETVAEHHDLLVTRAVFAGKKRTAQDRWNTEDLEEVGGGVRAGDLLRLAVAGDVRVPAPRDCERIEDVGALGD